MKNKTIADSMKKHFSNIRRAVETMQTGVIKRIHGASELSVNNVRRYNADYLAQVQAEMRANAECEIAGIKQTCTERCRAEFVEIDGLLTDWLVTPIPDDCATMLRAFKDYGIIPTRSELTVLSEISQGSYFANRALDSLAKNLGFCDFAFAPIDALRRELNTARKDCENAIANYSGVPDESHKLAADLLGLNLAENRNLIVFSADFLEKDNTFSRLERELSDVTQTEFSLLPSKRREIDALFADVADADKVDVAKRLIENDDNLRDTMELYDKKLYLDALARLADEKKSIAETLKASRLETDALADSAAQDAVLAATEATLATMRASHN